MRSNGSIRLAFAALTAFMSLASSLDLTEAGSASRYTQQMVARRASIEGAAVPVERAMVPAIVSERAIVPATVSERAIVPAIVSERAIVPAIVSERAMLPATASERPAVPAGVKERVTVPVVPGSLSAPAASARRCQVSPAIPASRRPV